MNADGSDNKLLTTSADSEGEPAWIKGGSKLAFITKGQIWEMNPDGTGRQQLSDYAGGIDGFKFSPDGTKVLFISQVNMANVPPTNTPTWTKPAEKSSTT